MVRLEEWMDIQALHEQGISIREIVRRSGRSRKAVRKVLRSGEPPGRVRRRRPSGLSPFEDHIRDRWFEYELSAVRLHEEVAELGYAGSAITVRRFVAELKRSRYGPKGATVRFETPPGRQAQADWAYAGRFLAPDGRLVSVYAFVMVLGFSRMRYVEFTTSMRLPALLQAMQRAFAYFGGVPGEVLFDNMKQVRLYPSGFNPLFLDFARHFGFAIRTHRVRRPRTKGKVERAVGFVKESFLRGRTFTDLADLSHQARLWMEKVNQRPHGTTGEPPCQRLSSEKLQPLASFSPYRLALPVLRKADREGFVRYQGSRYSVPPEHCGRRLSVGTADRRVVIRLSDAIIAEHAEAESRGATVAHREHVAAMWRLTRELLERRRPPCPSWRLTFNQTVAERPLASYEEA